MASLPIFVVGATLVAAVVFAFILDFAKVPVFSRLRIGNGNLPTLTLSRRESTRANLDVAAGV
jgi:hypothetical protein